MKTPRTPSEIDQRPGPRLPGDRPLSGGGVRLLGERAPSRIASPEVAVGRDQQVFNLVEGAVNLVSLLARAEDGAGGEAHRRVFDAVAGEREELGLLGRHIGSLDVDASS